MSNSTKTANGRLLVVTPTLGLSKFLHHSVASVTNLGLDVIHIISAPASTRLALLTRFPHATVVEDRGKGQGLYGALNAALDSCLEPWDWFTYINDDDLLLPNYAHVFRRHINTPQPEPVVYGDVDLIDETDRVVASITSESNPRWIPALLQQGISPLGQQGTTFSRETVQRIRGFNPEFRLCGDLDFWLRAYTAGFAFKYYKARIGQFRLRKGQLSSDTRLTVLEQQEIVRRNLGSSISTVRKQIAKWRYRANNLPKYLSRVKARGFRTSYQLLESGHDVQ